MGTVYFLIPVVGGTLLMEYYVRPIQEKNTEKWLGYKPGTKGDPLKTAGVHSQQPTHDK